MSKKLDLGSLPAQVDRYKDLLQNTIEYRKKWPEELKPMLIETLEYINEETNLGGTVEVKDNIENLESVVFNLGRSSSGLHENIDDSGIKRTMIKSNGALIYQQLFNGKVMVMTLNPVIEGYGEPKPPKMVEILRPEELKQAFVLRHMDIFLNDISEWEDYDDDAPEKKKQGFNPIGFNRPLEDDE